MRAQCEDVEETPASLMVEGVEDKRGLTGTGYTGDDRETVTEFDIDVLQIVLAGAFD
jgi:hypothetical protein